MTERIYDVIRAILYLQFPKNSQQIPVIYDRPVKNWYIGERSVVPDDITVMITASNITETDAFWGYRNLDYDIMVKLYAVGDDHDTTLRIATEGARIIRNILVNHRRIWVMDLCPICTNLPTSPAHFFVDSIHQSVFGVYGSEYGPTGPAGDVYNAFRTNWWKTHPTLYTPGNVAAINILSSGSGYTNPTIVITGGGYGAVGATATANLIGSAISSVTVNNIGQQYTNTPVVTVTDPTGNGAILQAVVAKPDTAGIGSNAFYQVLKNYQNGIIPPSLTSSQIARFNQIISEGVFPIRTLFDVQIQSLVPTDEFLEKGFESISQISIKCKELMPIQAFGPNFSGSNYDAQEAL